MKIALLLALTLGVILVSTQAAPHSEDDGSLSVDEDIAPMADEDAGPPQGRPAKVKKGPGGGSKSKVVQNAQDGGPPAGAGSKNKGRGPGEKGKGRGPPTTETAS